MEGIEASKPSVMITYPETIHFSTSTMIKDTDLTTWDEIWYYPKTRNDFEHDSCVQLKHPQVPSEPTQYTTWRTTEIHHSPNIIKSQENMPQAQAVVEFTESVTVKSSHTPKLFILEEEMLDDKIPKGPALKNQRSENTSPEL
ncbi:hypothetical protein Tco_0073605 [Tanacetum coccineum]